MHGAAQPLLLLLLLLRGCGCAAVGLRRRGWQLLVPVGLQEGVVQLAERQQLLKHRHVHAAELRRVLRRVLRRTRLLQAAPRRAGRRGVLLPVAGCGSGRAQAACRRGEEGDAAKGGRRNGDGGNGGNNGGGNIGAGAKVFG